jgi:c-di-GMP-binding flagellar brake protein YcgR
MKIGTILKIQIEGSPNRITSELVGAEEGKYLIVKMPFLKSLANTAKFVSKGTNIIIRYIHKGTVFGFKSRVSHFISDPVRLVFIEYPKMIENHELRAHKRVECCLPANVKVKDNKIEGDITDISKGGCQLVIEKAKVESSLILLVEDEINISFRLPGVRKTLTVAGKQKTLKLDGDCVNIGIEFDKLNIEVQERLYGFLLAAGA